MSEIEEARAAEYAAVGEQITSALALARSVKSKMEDDVEGHSFHDGDDVEGHNLAWSINAGCACSNA